MRTPPKLPPAPRSEEMPERPVFGWIGDPRWLSPAEIKTIERRIGPLSEANAFMWRAHCAFAYARRESPDTYPWALAAHLPLSELEPDADEDEGQEDEDEGKG